MNSLRSRSTSSAPLATCSRHVHPVATPVATPLRVTQLKPFRLSVCQPARRSCRQSFRRVEATAVQTSNDYNLSHSVSENSFEVTGDIDKIFEYAADFSHIDKWDSGELQGVSRQLGPPHSAAYRASVLPVDVLQVQLTPSCEETGQEVPLRLEM